MLDTKKTIRTTRSAAAKVLLAALMFCGTEALTGRASAADALTDAAVVAPPAAPTTQPTIDNDAVNLLTTGLDATGGKITLVVGQTRLLRSSVPLRTIDVTQPDVVVAKVVPPAADILLTGKKPGSTELVLWDEKGRTQSIQVIINADLAALEAELKKVLPTVEVEVTAANGAIVLKGRVPSSQVADQVVSVAGPYAGNSKIVNMLEIGGGQQVMLQVRFAEVSKDATTALGINWGISGGVSEFVSVPGQVAGIGVTQLPGTINPVLSFPNPGANVSQFGSFVSGKTPFEIFLTALRSNNLLRVLAEPNLTVVSGEQASFLAGGEFPYPVPQSNGSGGTTITIEYKPYGVRLNFTPVVLGDGRIRLNVSPEVSDLDYSNAVTLNGFVIPGLTERKANTTVELAEGQTLSLAGLLNTRVNATSQVTPILGDIPILGALFRSVRYEHSETELVVLVTPRLVEGMNPGQVPAITGEHWRYPTEPQVWASGDLGGPMADTAHAPQNAPPKQFEGSYGYSPAAPSVTKK